LGLFGGKPIRVATNAPRHWPAVGGEDWSRDNAAINYVLVGGSLAQGSGSAGRPLQLGFMQDYLYADGILRVPLVVEEEGQRTAVFAYPVADAAAAGHYSAARSLLRQRERMNAVYYAPGPIAPEKPATVLEPLDTPHFSTPDAERAPAAYALWWASAEAPSLAGSPVLSHLDHWFESLDGYASYLFTAFVRELELAGDAGGGKPEARLYAIPDEPFLAPVDGPAESKLYLHASQAEGLWLALDVRDTAPARRALLLGLLADLAARVRRAAEEMGLPPREEDRRALAFWRRTREDALAKEAGGAEGLVLGRIAEEGAARTRMPGATTAAERAAHRPTALPSEALTDFARGEIERAFVEIRKAAGAGGEEGPNLHPFVTARVGAQTQRTVLFLYTEPEAVAAAPQVLAERDGAELAALVCDGYLREGEKRTDAVIVHAQERGSAASHLFAQRYRPAAGGRPLALVGNWTLVGSGPSLFADGGPQACAEQPEEALARFVEECLAGHLRWITIGDPSGAELYREGAPLFSPRLELRVGSETFTSVFALGNLAWAEGVCPKTIAEKPDARFAVLLYDDVTTVDGRHARSLRLRGQERGAPRSWVYAQAYEVPTKGRPFTTSGALRLLGPAPSLFPSGTDAAVASPPAQPQPPPPDPAAAAAARHRLDLGRGTVETLRPDRLSVMHRGGPAVKRETDPTARLRFAAVKCEIEEGGLRVWLDEPEPRALPWAEIAEVSARQLPSDPPWDRALLVDFVPTAAAGGKPVPVRLVRSTLVNFRGLPGGPAVSLRENLRRLGTHVLARNPATRFETESVAFFTEGKECRAFASLGQIVSYDARYD
jgi:hypothetical protein